MGDVYILGSARTPFTKSFTGYKNISTQALMEHSLNALVSRYQLEGKTLGDVALGAVINSALTQNLSRECVLSTNLNPNTPGYTVQRACGTGLEAACQIFSKIKVGLIDTGIAGGVDSNSAAPIEVNESLRRALLRIKQSKSLVDRIQAIASSTSLSWGFKVADIVEPRSGLSMGEHCELMVKEWGVTQREQDEVALRSHQRAAKAYSEKFYEDLIVPVGDLSIDTFVRVDTSLEKLSKLKPAFDETGGTITAGNASPLSDGSSAVLIANMEGARALNLEPMAKIIDIQVSAVDFVHGEGLLMAPTYAIARLLERNKLSLQDFDLYEIHEAFAGQVVCTLKALDSSSYCREKLGLGSKLGEIPDNKMNIVGGSIALGHPFAATGGRILGSLAKLLAGTQKRGLISICTAGGMGIAAIVEGVDS